MSKTSRVKGHRFERQIAQWLRRWFPACATSRAESRSRDAQCVDLVSTGFLNVQCKAVEKMGSYHRILAGMPDEEGRVNCIAHKRNRQGIVFVFDQRGMDELMEMLREGGSMEEG